MSVETASIASPASEHASLPIHRVRVGVPFSPFTQGAISSTRLVTEGIGIHGQIVATKENLTVQLQEHIRFSTGRNVDDDLTPLVALKVDNTFYIGMDAPVSSFNIDGESHNGFSYSLWRKVDEPDETRPPEDVSGPLSLVVILYQQQQTYRKFG